MSQVGMDFIYANLLKEVKPLYFCIRHVSFCLYFRILYSLEKQSEMRSKVFFMCCLFILGIAAHGQSDQTIWNSEMKIEDNKYILNLPDQWKKVTVTAGLGLDYKFDFTGVGIPATVGGAPLYAYFTISRIAGNKHGQAMYQVLNDFSVFYDRVTEPGYNYDTTVTTIKSGQTGTVLHSRYYRRSKVSNYSKYYLIIYSPKSDETFILALNFQYKEPSYDIERSAHFKDYATQVFSHFEFR